MISILKFLILLSFSRKYNYNIGNYIFLKGIYLTEKLKNFG